MNTIVTGPRGLQRRILSLGLLVIAIGAFVLCFNSYGLPLFPAKTFVLIPGAVHPWTDGSGKGYAFEFSHSEGDEALNPRSRTTLTEDGRPLGWRLRNGEYNQRLGQGSWLHNSHAIVFTASDNSDPRTNGRQYVLRSPRLYTRSLGLGAGLALVVSILGLYVLHFRPAPLLAGTAAADRWWTRSLLVTSTLFLAGLYCSTGTLAPYANTYAAIVSRSTGYLYNIDHAHYRALFAFVDGQDRSLWDKALLLRRILFPTLAWPFMKLAGFEIGGVVAGMLFNFLGFLVAAHLIRRQTGARAGIVALWLMALYPGAAYWAGLPYVNTLIFPSSLLLLHLVTRLEQAAGRALVLVSLGMGVLYLGYDLYLFFLPASLLVLLRHRRFDAAAATTVLQLAPLAAWMLWLAQVEHQPLGNSNSGVYGAVIRSYLQLQDFSLWGPLAVNAVHAGFDVFFGANFIFLPALFILIVAINPLTSRIALRPAEIALLVTALAIFLFNNLAPAYDSSWKMRGMWIARLYQPIFPVLIVYIARWWQQLPTEHLRIRRFFYAALGLTLTGNALILFGPILNNPFGLSETAFYRFYDHTDAHQIYGEHLRVFGRRPLGFPQPQESTP